ncbi:hypothetical protein HDV63DRAFT_111962 [Trichoderma sp. SZMC 28014]
MAIFSYGPRRAPQGDLASRACTLLPNIDLVLVTTAGRVHVLGKHPIPGHTYIHTRITALRSESDYLYVDDSAGILELALSLAPSEIEDPFGSLSLPEPTS